ncbi:histidinol-phosphatase HisJ [Ureibacillus terrenus]|uniref:histidinol-phosphatase HisJ n=1 Tax=Ureibacillus terrenus TaxID=118246 RepID=UPI002E1B7FCF|nr:histidinol-phosphatase HisJ [Ureibacillus terrenus]
MKKDGHIHTPFCPHGTADPLEQYIEKAIQHRFTDITFTEHAPLPGNFTDPTPEKDSGMKPELLSTYIETLEQLKRKYKNDINIHIGLEVDFIAGFEEETKNFLDQIGPRLDDAILSVHFLKWNDEYVCIDYSETEFMKFAEKVGNVEAVYDLYYDTVIQSIEADLGQFKPRRIGHPTLVHKFQHAHNILVEDEHRIKEVLNKMKEFGFELDVNSAGLSKKYCREPYPPFPMIEYAKSIRLPLVFGSDAHSVKDLHQHYEKIFP